MIPTYSTTVLYEKKLKLSTVNLYAGYMHMFTFFYTEYTFYRFACSQTQGQSSDASLLKHNLTLMPESNNDF